MRFGLENIPLFQSIIAWVANNLVAEPLSLQHQLAMPFGCCCGGAGVGPGSAPRRLTCPRPVPHLHIAAAANPAGWGPPLARAYRHTTSRGGLAVFLIQELNKAPQFRI